jgi:hypothetical protein
MAFQISTFEPSISPKFGLELYAHRVGRGLQTAVIHCRGTEALSRASLTAGRLAMMAAAVTVCDLARPAQLQVSRRVPRFTCDFC